MIHKNKILLIIFIGLLGITAIAGFVFFRRNSPKTVSNVLLISIDTCRADHLSCYGFDRSTTPQIDAIARGGMLFLRAQTPVPMTLPAHCSMLTGCYPPTHQVRDNYRYRLSDSQVTLAEILRQHGFATAGIVSAVVLTKQFGLHQGFDNYQDNFTLPERIGQEATDLACDFLTEHQRDPFFLFLHYYDPHHPYSPPAPYAKQYADDLYSGEIAYTDYCIGQVMDKLKELNLYDSTLLVIVGDHGEGLGDHNELAHEYLIYQSTIHVPFIIKGPGVSAGKVYNDTVSLVDVAPTILGSLGLPAPDNMQGVDLSPFFTELNEPETSRPVYIESLIPTKFGCNALLGVTDQKWSYIKSHHPELYDLQKDPGERINLADQQDQRVRWMEAHLQDLITRMARYGTADHQLQLDADTRKSLESLGYVDIGFLNENLTLDPNKLDPKEMMLCHEYFSRAELLLNETRYEESEAFCLKVTSQWPQITAVYPVLLTIGLATENPEKILKYGQAYADLHPENELQNNRAANFQLKETLAFHYGIISEAAAKLQQYKWAVEYGEKSLNLSSDFSYAPMTRNALAQAYFGLKQPQKAFELWQEALKESPDSPDIYQSMGNAYFLLGDLDQAADYCNRALKLNPGLIQMRNNLQIISNLRRVNQSIAEYSEMLRQSPNDPTLHSRLGNFYFQKGLHNQAADSWRQAIRLKPDWYEPYINLAGLLATTTDPNLYDPREALTLAEKAARLNEFENAAVLESYSNILAANNKYEEAIKIAETAVTKARLAGNKDLVEKLNRLIIQFKSKK